MNNKISNLNDKRVGQTFSWKSIIGIIEMYIICQKTHYKNNKTEWNQS
jgi:hypothetical protein